MGLAEQAEDGTAEGMSAGDDTAAPRWPQRWLGSIRVRILALVVTLPVVASIGSVLVLRAVLFQLATNAVKVTTTGDRIVIGTRGRDGRVTLWVEDSGPGVPSDQAEQIFTRSARGESTDGAGLGLAIVRAIADAHHGTVTVTSQPGSGARFEITLPAAEVGP